MGLVGRSRRAVAVLAVAVVVPVTLVTAASSQATSFAKAPPELSAWLLATDTEIGAGIGWTTLEVEDDGGLTDASNAYVSTARVLTSGGAILTIRLTSAKDEKAATEIYESATEGVQGRRLFRGDEGLAGTGVGYVRDGAQVLEVTSEPIAGASTTPEQIDQQAVGGASTLALNMTGDAAKKPFIGIPERAQDPCKVVTAADFKAVFGGKVTAEPVVSEEPPGLACSYTTADGTYTLSIVTNEQLLSAAPPTDVYSRFDEIGPPTVAALSDRKCAKAAIFTLVDDGSSTTPTDVTTKMQDMVTKAAPPKDPPEESVEQANARGDLSTAQDALQQVLADYGRAQTTPGQVDLALIEVRKAADDLCRARGEDST